MFFPVSILLFFFAVAGGNPGAGYVVIVKGFLERIQDAFDSIRVFFIVSA